MAILEKVKRDSESEEFRDFCGARTIFTTFKTIFHRYLKVSEFLSSFIIYIFELHFNNITYMFMRPPNVAFS
jgi:hypothetical protein